jgi:hypothetical protein
LLKIMRQVYHRSDTVQHQDCDIAKESSSGELRGGEIPIRIGANPSLGIAVLRIVPLACCGRTHEWHLDHDKALRHLAFHLGALLRLIKKKA